MPVFQQDAPAPGYCSERGSSAFHPLVTSLRAGGVPPFTTWLWGAEWDNPEQTKAELHLGVRAVQITGAFSSFTSCTVVTTLLGFKPKSSPSADIFVSVVSGWRKAVGMARGKELKFNVWGLSCSSHYTVHKGCDLCWNLTQGNAKPSQP